MKLSRLMTVMALGCMAIMLMLSPVANIAGAQGNPTATPLVVVITATPQGGGFEPAVTETPGGQTAPSGTQSKFCEESRENAAFCAARAVLQKKLGKNLTIVNAWSWEVAIFPDNYLGCPPQDATNIIKGEVPGYRITIQPLGDSNIYELRVTGDLKQVFDCGTAGTAAAPAAGGGAGPIVNLGAFELGGHALDLSASTANVMRSAKMKWVKKQVRLSNFGAAFGIIQNAKAQGFKVLIGLVGEPNDITVPGFFDSFAQRAAEVAKAGADAIEVWNEQNLDREWPTGQINPATYVEMLKKAYAAIKAANPNTIVISGAPAPTGAAGPGGKNPAYWNDDVYMAEMAAAGAANYLDCVGLHYNEGIVSPTQAGGDPRGGYPTYFFSTMLSRGLAAFPGRQACWTELGFLSPEGYGPLPAGFAWAKDTSVAEQAQWLSEAVRLSVQSGRVKLLIVWNVDFPTYSGSDPVAGYAMIRPGGGCPACASLAATLP